MLDARALNRALLARQHLLERVSTTAIDEIEHLVGMQAQAPLAPYVGLWSRLVDFDTAELATAVEDRRVVRSSFMRSTIHLVTASDAFPLRAWTQPALTRGFASTPFARRLAGIDLDALVDFGREVLDDKPLNRAALGRRLAERWPDGDQEAMAYAVTTHIPLVQVPPRGVWGLGGAVAWTPMELWLGPRVEEDPDPTRWIVRYLRAFGPATLADVSSWSGVTRLGQVMADLRPSLVSFRDVHKRELFDLPDAPRPDPDTPAPPRFLPEYDNILLGHADRSRIMPPGRGIPLLPGNGGSSGTILVDGMYAGTWAIARSGERATLRIVPFEPLSPDERTALEREGARLLEFAAKGYRPDIVTERPTT
ncbi:MAG: winged helix DNA-binding domain-containing protein [Chloroflexota bacterium]